MKKLFDAINKGDFETEVILTYFKHTKYNKEC